MGPTACSHFWQMSPFGRFWQAGRPIVPCHRWPPPLIEASEMYPSLHLQSSLTTLPKTTIVSVLSQPPARALSSSDFLTSSHAHVSPSLLPMPKTLLKQPPQDSPPRYFAQLSSVP